ncbi:MAG TPA: 16S rRNA (guanine(527)-N(7))-methyltransferase RsmG [Candidatus Angelobacter sp.]
MKQARAHSSGLERSDKNSMQTREIAALLRPFVEPDQKLLENISIYINLLLKWNARVNLTAVRAPAEIVQRHFGESFFAAAHLLGPESAESVIDVGSGAGFPGVPIAMLRPKAQVTLIESNGKKAAFLNEVLRTLKLGSAKVFQQRAESYAGSAGLVTMRAVERFSQAASLALKLVAPGGRLALMIGASQSDEAKGLDSQINWQSPISMPGGHSRILLVGTKSVTSGTES